MLHFRFCLTGRKKILPAIFAGTLFFGGAANAAASVESFAIPLRGIVEGFYGTPWQQADRLDMLNFCGAHGFNAYIYAPKDDPYHRAKWREPYPPDKTKEIAELIQFSKERQIRFIFAISPGLDIHFEGEQGLQDRLAMKKKLQAMYALGVRDFAVFFDDIQDKNGKGQSDFLNWIDEQFIAAHKDITSLITVPTEYFYEDMQQAGSIKPYSKAFSQNLNPDILVLYTGNGVVPDGIADQQLLQANTLYNRPLGIWWNYPVTDYIENKLALGPVEKLPRQTNIPAIFFNPMKYEQLSKIALATGADYAKNPKNYKEQKSWEAAIADQYGPLAEDMLRIAEQSQHLENSWAKIGRADGAELRKKMDNYWQLNCQPAAGEELIHELLTLRQSAVSLQNNLPPRLLAECAPQLAQMIRIADADITGIQLIRTPEDAAGKKKFCQQMAEVTAHDKEALIAESSARAFLTELAQKINCNAQ